MKVLIQEYVRSSFGNFKSNIVEIEPDQSIEDLKEKINQIFNVDPNNQKLSILDDDHETVPLVDSKKISFYSIKENQLITLETIEAETGVLS